MALEGAEELQPGQVLGRARLQAVPQECPQNIRASAPEVAPFESRTPVQEFLMSADSKKSMGWTIVLVLLGVVALVGGVKWLVLLIPAAMLIWYGAAPILRSGRN
jgi:hypothetical protein